MYPILPFVVVVFVPVICVYMISIWRKRLLTRILSCITYTPHDRLAAQILWCVFFLQIIIRKVQAVKRTYQFFTIFISQCKLSHETWYPNYLLTLTANAALTDRIIPNLLHLRQSSVIGSTSYQYSKGIRNRASPASVLTIEILLAYFMASKKPPCVLYRGERAWANPAQPGGEGRCQGALCCVPKRFFVNLRRNRGVRAASNLFIFISLFQYSFRIEH